MAISELDYSLARLAEERKRDARNRRLAEEHIRRGKYSTRLRKVANKQRPVRRKKHERKW